MYYSGSYSNVNGDFERDIEVGGQMNLLTANLFFAYDHIYTKGCERFPGSENSEIAIKGF